MAARPAWRRRSANGALALGLLALLGACAGDAPEQERKGQGNLSDANEVARAKLAGADGKGAGNVSLREVEGGLLVRLRASNLEPGFHGFHVHASGRCDRDAREAGQPAPFATAGPHLARGGTSHGQHSGDLPPVLIDEEGETTYSVVTNGFTVEELTEGDGTAFVVHAEPDNLANIPGRYAAEGSGSGPDSETRETGDSGDRVACGKVTRAG